jgi:uncharacterized protein YeaO (DUF488 family)
MIRIKRAYEEPADEDGERILVDRLWPRGISKERAKIDRWLKDLAPSPELRKRFDHDPAKWEDFRRRYRQELEAHRASMEALAMASRKADLTLIYAAKDELHNDAVVLLEVLEELAR